MTDEFRFPNRGRDDRDKGREPRSLGLYRLMQHRGETRPVRQGLYFRGYEFPLGGDRNGTPEWDDRREPWSLYRLFSTSTSQSNKKVSPRREEFPPLAALVNGQLVPTYSPKPEKEASLREVFNVRRVVGEVGCVLDDAARTQGVRLLLTVNSSLPTLLRGAATVIRQVLFEMGSLVIHGARPASGVTIRVTEDSPLGSERRLRFTIEAEDTEGSRRDGLAVFVEGGEALDMCRALLGPVEGAFGAEHTRGRSLFWFTVTCHERGAVNPETADGSMVA